jgi:hypothetical protein
MVVVSLLLHANYTFLERRCVAGPSNRVLQYLVHGERNGVLNSDPQEGPAHHVPAVLTETVEWCAPAVLRLA